MSTVSNLYAEKVFAEHPLALWSLDDRADFVNLLNLASQDFTANWTISGGSIVPSTTENQGGPISDAPTSSFVSLTTTSKIILTSSPITSFNALDPLKDSFSVGFYFKSASATIRNVVLKYQSTSHQDSKTFVVDTDNEWVFISHSFSKPASTETFSLVIEINFSQTIPGSAQQFFINGISLGQWSEDFHFSSSGVQPVEITEPINLPGTLYGIPASVYGFKNSNGYYLAANNALRSYNAGFPMVYGASGVTKISPNAGLPSLIFPGYGFLNDIGQYKEYTAEMWIKINSRSVSPRRIFGPINSEDGLYVDGSYLILKIGDNVVSHFVREWHRPMLLHIRVVNNAISLLVNGEQVISQIIDTNALEMPSRASQAGLSNDWLGFYGYSDVPMIELDCFAIYSYQVPEVVAKRRFVYGQGVEFPESINSSFGGDSAFIDYRFSEYSNSYNYPDIGRWEQGYSENLNNDNNILSAPNLSLPDIILQNNADPDQWILDSEQAFESSSEAYSFLDFSTKQGYLLFEDFNVAEESTEAIYGVFKTSSPLKQTLFKIEDKSNRQYIAAYVQGNTLSYVFGEQGVETVLQSSDTHTPGVFFNVGINIEKFRSVNSKASALLGNKGRLRVYVAGQSSFSNGFLGKMYRFGFSTSRNLSKITELFADNGTALDQPNVFELSAVTDGGEPSTTFAQNAEVSGGIPGTTTFEASLDGGSPTSTKTLSLVSHIASYTLIPKSYLGSFKLDIGCDSYWQDYVPLQYFAKYVENQENELVYGLDFLQINLGYTKLQRYLLENYKTDDLPIRSFVSFQYLSSGANNNDQYFPNTQPVPADGVVYPGTSWLNTKYEILDDTIVYLPEGVDFSQIAIVFHIQFSSSGIFTNTFKLKSLQVAGQSLSYHNPTRIGTRFGNKITPYRLRGVYKDYKTSNPFSIYKGSSPYLYLTSTTGISLRGSQDEMDSRALSFPINKNRSSTYRLGAVQLAARYQDTTFPEGPTRIFKIGALNSEISFYLEPTNSSRTRARIYAINSATQLPVAGLSYYLNGKRVKDLNIVAEEWNMIGFQILNALNFDSFEGTFDLVGPLMINNIAAFQLSDTQQATTTVFRTWAQVPNMLDKEDDPDTVNIDESVSFWADFVSEEYLTSWGNVLFIPTLRTASIDPVKVYTSYTGTNKSIVSNPKTLRLGDYSYRIYKDIDWQSTIRKPV